MACPNLELRLKPSVYQPRRPEKTILYQTVQKELETWLIATSEQIPNFIEDEFRSFLKCGILAYGFARAHCDECGHDSLIAFSCKGRGICPSCNTRHMAQIAAHLTDNVFPKLPVRQWVLSFPKRIRYFLSSNPEIVSAVMNILITAIESGLICACSRNSTLPEGCRLGAVTFIQRFGKALNSHFHFHSCIIDGLFDKEGQFYPINSLSSDDIQSVQEHIRKRVLRLFRAKGLLDSDAASDMLEWENGGFSLNANVRIESHDRDGLERLIRYCARPVFASERLGVVGENLRYTLPKPTPDGQTIMLFKPKELLDKLAQLIPPPKRHRHHYHGVLAPSSPLRAKIIGSELKCKKMPPKTQTIEENLPFLLPPSEEQQQTMLQQTITPPQPEDSPSPIQEPDKKPIKPASLYPWALLMARIYEVNPLTCPKCTHNMRIISFIQDRPTICKILNHIQEPCDPPVIIPARGPPEPEFNYDQSFEFSEFA